MDLWLLASKSVQNKRRILLPALPKEAGRFLWLIWVYCSIAWPDRPSSDQEKSRQALHRFWGERPWIDGRTGTVVFSLKTVLRTYLAWELCLNLWDTDMYSLKLGGWSQKIVYLTYVLIIFHHWFYTSLNDWPFGCTSPRGVFFGRVLVDDFGTHQVPTSLKVWNIGRTRQEAVSRTEKGTNTLPETNIAMENPPFWWYLPGKMGIFMGYVSFREGMENSWKFQSPSEIERWWKGKEIAPKRKIRGSGIDLWYTDIRETHWKVCVWHFWLAAFEKNQSKKS